MAAPTNNFSRGGQMSTSKSSIKRHQRKNTKTDVDYRVIDRLRQLAFPDSVAATVQYVDAFLYGQQGAIPSVAVARQLADEFIFLQGNQKKKKYTGVQELQLLDILLKQLEMQENPQIRTKFYLLLFSGVNDTYKTELQCRLVSLAVATDSAKVLDATAEWMKEQRFCGRPCIELTQYVITDYCRLHPGAGTNLRKLPLVSPQFTCSLITALTHVYNSHKDLGEILPPLVLLETIATWVSSDSCLLLATAAPSPVSPNCTETACPGLISWCILAPILITSQRVKSESCAKVIDAETATRSLSLYSRLHLGILNTVLTTVNMPYIQKEFLPMSCLKEFVEDYRELVKPVVNAVEQDYVQTGLERLAQLLQVAMTAKCLHADKRSLRKLCSSLPKNKLLDMVLGDESVS